MEEQHTAPDAEAAASTHPDRWRVIRDLIVFQVKLALDGMRDVLLSPISLFLGIYGLLFGGRNPGKHFYRLCHLGHHTDRWINLFGAAETTVTTGASSDEWIEHAEKALREKYPGGGIVPNTRDAADNLLDATNKSDKN